MILVDTSVWIDFFNGINSEERHLLSKFIAEDKPIAVTDIILTEILQGISLKDAKSYEEIKEYMLAFNFYHANAIETYISAANIYRNCRTKGKTIRKTIDCIIAAICIENDLTLLHKDSDFLSIAECSKLKIYLPNTNTTKNQDI